MEANDKNMAPRCRLMEADDVAGVCKLMEEIRPNIGGLQTRSLYHAICRDALRDKRITLAVIEQDGELAGFALAIARWTEYQRGFPLRYPILGAQIVLRKILRKLRPRSKKNAPADAPQMEQWLADDAAGRSWRDSGDDIAKVIFLGISRPFRGRRLAGVLSRYFRRQLTRRGIRRVDAFIEADNYAAVRSVHRSGYRIVRECSGLFATKDLPTDSVEDGDPGG